MKFLLNSEVLDLGLPEAMLRDLLGRESLELDLVSAQDAIELGQALYFDAGPDDEPAPRVRRALACLLALTTGVDAVRLVRPAGATGPEEVRVRFAAVPVSTMDYLSALASAGELTSMIVHEAVWSGA